ncbi:hypothetical protein [Streptomyces sp. S.PNR 29]|uniref:hypothetical protein n=1 Tax=Streptomyces sp. S.PNR 29 TaxID=2973805 RepID=UPI0025AFE978|nr:hypothetical protein [Streptomyces sp. S.PNR 29]MDN0195306.1 hypothetical protein [Streptomyces sp. S.PNR 29]
MVTGIRPAREIRGPIADRLCLSAPSGHVWIERLHRPGAQYLGADQISLLRTVLPTAHLPQVRSAELAVWPVVPSPELLSDRMLTPTSAEDDAGWTHVLRALGQHIAEVHRVPVTPALRTALPDRGRGPAWLDDEVVAAGVRAWRARLPLDVAPALASSARRAGGPARVTLVHGRLSAGACAPGPVLLAWREAGVGDPLRDLAHLLAELVETAALFDRPPSTVELRARAFLGAYQEAHGERLTGDERARLWDLTAHRVIEHYAQGAWASQDATGAAATLPAVERCWAAVRTAEVAP